MSNGRRANGVKKTTWPQPAEYYRYYAIENADWDAVEILIEGRGLKKPGVTEEALHEARIRAAAGNGALSIVGSPDDVVASMKRLYISGVTALAMGFTNYLEHFPYFRDEVLPRLAHERLRAGQRF